MSKERYGLLHLTRSDGFAFAILSIVAFVLVYTWVFGPSPEVALGMLGVLVTTAVIEFRYKPPQ